MCAGLLFGDDSVALVPDQITIWPGLTLSGPVPDKAR